MKSILVLMLILLSSCAGYRVKTMDNPFHYYGIYSVSVPMFINHSVFAQASGDFTREITLELQGHSGLKVSSGDNYKETDAVLLGIVSSPQSLKMAKLPSSPKFISGSLKDSIGKRQPFYLSSETEMKLSLRLILIKKPSQAELELLSKVYPERFLSPRVIFDESFPLTYKYSRVIEGNQNSSNSGVLNLTKNYGLTKSAIKAMAKNSTVQFRELIINAF